MTHKSVETGCNSRLAALHLGSVGFLERLSERTIDLEDPFKKHYVDWRFRGSTSIKRILPVIAPDLRYDETKVHDGTGAVEAWSRMIELAPGPERDRIRQELLDYCCLDTLAMVRIFQFLATIP